MNFEKNITLFLPIFLFIFLFNLKLGYCQSVTRLLEEGHQLYEEELDFEGAIEAFTRVVNSSDSTENEKLEALEYIAGAYFALGNEQSSRDTMRRIVEINDNYMLRGQTHPPPLQDMLEEVRQQYQREQEAQHQQQTQNQTQQTTNVEQSTTEQEYEEEEEEEDFWYKKWWVWTIIGVVVAGGSVGLALGLTMEGETEDPPQGNLPPFIVNLPDL